MNRMPRILLGTGAAIGGSYLCITASKLAPTRGLQFSSSPQNPQEFTNSRSQALANPRGHVAFTETLSVTLKVSRCSPLDNLTDEQILARIVKGFLGGWVIAPERWYLRVTKADIAQFQEIPNPLPNISSPTSMPERHLPSLHTRLIGGFIILHKHILEEDLHHESMSKLHPQTSTSYIDLGFGFNKPGSTFCGVDRIAITREPNYPNTNIAINNDNSLSDSRNMRITYSAMACNPSVNAITLSKFALSVHSFYARLLFREGIARVLKNGS